jgi:hypothetical protein
LLDQMRAIESCARGRSMGIDAYFCDSGRRDGSWTRGFHLGRLLMEVRAGRIGIVFVQSVARLAEDGCTATMVAAEIEAGNALLVEAAPRTLETMRRPSIAFDEAGGCGPKRTVPLFHSGLRRLRAPF